MKLKSFIVVCFVIHLKVNVLSQFEIIQTNTNANLTGIVINNDKNETFIVGSQLYIAKFDNIYDIRTLHAPGPKLNFIHSLNRIDSNNLYILSSSANFGIDSNFIFKSNDDGESWNEIFDTTDLIMSDLIMFDSLEGLFFSSMYTYFSTVNGCINFTRKNSPAHVSFAHQKYKDSIVAMGYFNQFIISFDRGKNWDVRNYLMELPTSFDFISMDSIVSLASGYFAKSIDGGFTWQKKNFIGSYISKIKHQPENNNTLFIVGGIVFYDSLWNEHRQGVIYKSYDFGETWHTYNTGLPTRFLNMEFISDSVALISGTDGYLIKYFYRDHHLGFEELNDQLSDIKLYPNPTSQLQQIEIKTINSENIKVSLLDVFGKEIKTVNELEFHDEVYTASFDLSNLSSGFYVYKITIGERVTYLKSQKI
jgi:photosystem II stability/assembly factor-like uncharacterized protein